MGGGGGGVVTNRGPKGWGPDMPMSGESDSGLRYWGLPKTKEKRCASLLQTQPAASAGRAAAQLWEVLLELAKQGEGNRGYGITVA